MSLRTSCAALFLDTNVLIHYPWQDVDWCTLAGCGTVILLLAPVTITELGAKNDDYRAHKNIRERSHNALRQLEDYNQQQGPVQIGKGVSLEFISHEPQIDFGECRLSETVPDDRLLATIIEYTRGNPNAPVSLVTNDLGLRFKARSQGITTIKPPAEQRHQEPPDDARKRIRQLEEENRSLKDRIPKLSVILASAPKIVRRRRSENPPVPLEAVKTRNRPIGNQSREAIGLIQSLQIRSVDIENYNARLERYWDEYSRYLSDHDAFYRQVGIRLRLRIRNDGTCPAEKVTLWLHLPGHLIVFDQEQPPAPPEPPSPPPKSAIGFGLMPPPLDPLCLMPKPVKPTPLGGPKIESGRTIRVTYSAIDVQHHVHTDLRPLCVFFPKPEDLRSFNLGGELVAANVPEKVPVHVPVSIPEGGPASDL